VKTVRASVLDTAYEEMAAVRELAEK